MLRQAPFGQRAISVQTASENILSKLDVLIEQLDRGTIIQPADIEDIISELQSINNDISVITSELNNAPSADKDNVCGMIRLISMAWLGIGASSVMSLIGPILNIISKQANPDLKAAHLTRSASHGNICGLRARCSLLPSSYPLR